MVTLPEQVKVVEIEIVFADIPSKIAHVFILKYAFSHCCAEGLCVIRFFQNKGGFRIKIAKFLYEFDFAIIIF